jgi:hypothetical protein
MVEKVTMAEQVDRGVGLNMLGQIHKGGPTRVMV